MCQEGARKIIILKYGNAVKKALAVIICVSVIYASAAEAFAAHKDYNEKDIQSVIENIINHKKQQLGVDKASNLLSALAVSAGTTAGDWYAFSVGRLGIDDDYFSYLTALQDYVESKYKTADKLDKTKSTEWHRIALAVLACGGNPRRMGERGEIDLIARDGRYLVFIEVKYRKNLQMGDPLEAVDVRKQQRIYQTARYYLHQKKWENIPCRFDVIGITGTQICHIRNAFGSI